MSEGVFRTPSGQLVPAITAGQMREVDRIAMEEFGLGLLQMMENAGRNLALSAMDLLGAVTGEVTILAGAGGNGGGGLCCGRHLRNHGFDVHLVLDRPADDLHGAAGQQLHTLRAAGLEPLPSEQVAEAIRHADLVMDALIGYSLRGAPRGQAAELIELCNHHATRVLSLDLPSGLDATTGGAPGVVVRPQRTLTLALPKTGLRGRSGELYLADIGIPPEVFDAIGVPYDAPFDDQYIVPLTEAD